MNLKTMLAAVDTVFDALCKRLGVADGTDAYLVSHWQGDGFRVQVTRKTDGAVLTKFVCADGRVTV